MPSDFLALVWSKLAVSGFNQIKISDSKEELEVHYCDPLTLESVYVKRFKTLDELEAYLYSSR